MPLYLKRISFGQCIASLGLAFSSSLTKPAFSLEHLDHLHLMWLLIRLSLNLPSCWLFSICLIYSLFLPSSFYASFGLTESCLWFYFVCLVDLEEWRPEKVIVEEPLKSELFGYAEKSSQVEVKARCRALKQKHIWHAEIKARWPVYLDRQEHRRQQRERESW